MEASHKEMVQNYKFRPPFHIHAYELVALSLSDETRYSGLVTAEKTREEFGVVVDGSQGEGELLAIVLSQIATHMNTPIIARASKQPRRRLPTLNDEERSQFVIVCHPGEFIFKSSSEVDTEDPEAPRHQLVPRALIPHMMYEAVGATLLPTMCVIEFRGGERIGFPRAPLFSSGFSRMPVKQVALEAPRIVDPRIFVHDAPPSAASDEDRFVHATVDEDEFSVVDGRNWVDHQTRAWTCDMDMHIRLPDHTHTGKNCAFVVYETRAPIFDGQCVRLAHPFSFSAKIEQFDLLLSPMVEESGPMYAVRLVNERRALPVRSGRDMQVSSDTQRIFERACRRLFA